MCTCTVLYQTLSVVYRRFMNNMARFKPVSEEEMTDLLVENDSKSSKELSNVPSMHSDYF